METGGLGIALCQAQDRTHWHTGRDKRRGLGAGGRAGVRGTTCVRLEAPVVTCA